MRTPAFTDSAFDLSSIGIGTQREIVDMLTGQRPSSEYAVENAFGLIQGNLLCSLGEDAALDLPRFETFRERLRVLTRQMHAFERQRMRAAVADKNVTPHGRPFGAEEFDRLMQTVFGVASWESVPADLRRLLYKEVNEEGAALMKLAPFIREFPPENREDAWSRFRHFSRRVESLTLSPLFAPRALVLHAKKLSWMADFFADDVGSETFGNGLLPDDPTGKLARNWKMLFNEELPDANALIAGARESVRRAALHIRHHRAEAPDARIIDEVLTNT